MKILLVNDYATPTAGAEIMLLVYRDGLRARGHDVRVFASRAELIPGPSFADYTCFGTTSRLQALNSALNLSARVQLAKVLKEFQPDVVHVKMFLWQLSPLILSLLKDVPAVYQIVTYKAICPNGKKLLPDGSVCRSPAGTICLSGGCLTPQSWLAMMLQRRLWLRQQNVFDAFVTPSPSMKRWLENEGIGPVEVISNACRLREPRAPLSGDPILAFAGRLSEEKGIGTMIRAFAEIQDAVPGVRLWIAGDGPEGASLKRLAREVGIEARTDFFGALPFEEMDRRFERAWAQIVPSKWDEPFGMVAIEALMRGTAVVASNTGGPGDIVEEGESGVLFPPGDVSALAGAMLKVARDRQLCETLGARGHEIALERYGHQSVPQRLEALFERVIEGGRGQ